MALTNTWRALTAAGLLLLTAAADPPRSPAELYGPLFEAVQRERVFDDGKTFVDATARATPQAILEAYARERPRTRAELKAFVARHFILPDAPAETRADDLVAHIRGLWPQLTRPPLDPPAGSSALALPAPYVVPGGRFREIYYWDSYFTMLGLRVDGRGDLIEGMLADFVSLVDRYGHIPNGTRTYYLSRSQPPFFALMVGLSDSDSPALAKARLAALRAEHAYWMRGAACAQRQGACERVVRMPDGTLLNRYWDDKSTPRDESWAEDVATARESNRDAAIMYRHLRAGAESGWDYSSRWLSDPRRLATIRTTDIVPVDLNSLMWTLEDAIATRCRAGGDRECARDFATHAERRRAAISRYLWNGAEGRFGDWDRETRQVTPVLSAATLYPLFAGIASKAQAAAVAATVRAKLLAPGGLRTTLTRTGQQWDAPNGWAPLQWIAVDGLARYGEDELAREIATRWIGNVERAWRETGKMLEKYDVEERRPGGGGEYPLQDGFGWTNGVTRALIARYGEGGGVAGE
ncbi:MULTISPECIES: alpha,alpha-trehalase TreF [unclassified Sphingomonas]|uniref:alpha,alpha-trehalase TreF n=1 Tax=unclassified Sphingomonas TaxID=196159 RepID=UPI00083668AF|nr:MULTISPECIES: alpha,alpha-trehalase TreF [unclassified Sphingomonas]